MKHIRFCATRKDVSKVVFLIIILVFTVVVTPLVFIAIKGVNDLLSYLLTILIFLLIFVFFCVMLKKQYCNGEVVFWAFITKKNIVAIGPMSYARLKIKNVQNIIVWQTWIYKFRYGERNKPKGAKPRHAEFTGNNGKNFYLQRFFIIVPSDFDIDLDMKADAIGKPKLTSENYKKYKKIANDKNIIMLDGTTDNYEYLRQEFKYEKFVGINKSDIKWLEEIEKN